MLALYGLSTLIECIQRVACNAGTRHCDLPARVPRNWKSSDIFSVLQIIRHRQQENHRLRTVAFKIARSADCGLHHGKSGNVLQITPQVSQQVRFDSLQLHVAGTCCPYECAENWRGPKCRSLQVTDTDKAILDLSLIHISEPTRPY